MNDECPLTLEDLAAILAGDNDLVDATAGRLAVFFRHDHRFASMREQLATLARDAGLAPEVDNYRDAVDLHEMLDRLLAMRSWKDPAEVLDRNSEGLQLDRLLGIAEARAARSEAPTEELERVRQRLGRAREAERQARQRLNETAAAAPQVVEEWVQENFPRPQARR